MKITNQSKLLQNARPHAILFGCLVAALVLSATSPVYAEYAKHSFLQAVGNNGYKTSDPFSPGTYKGIVLNNPDDMLNTSAGAPAWMGGMWQVFIQSVETDDWGGSALWMGQYYGKRYDRDEEESYTDAEWEAEMLRVNYPIYNGSSTTEPLRAGDLIEVEANGSLFYAGKRNINEEHHNGSEYDFHITILERDQILPGPTTIQIANVKDESDYIFNATDPDEDGTPLGYDDVEGCEKYQSQRVTLQNVRLKEGEAVKWEANAMLTLIDADNSDLEFSMHLGLNEELATMTPPSGVFNVTGIFNQEADATYMDGYELWVMNTSDINVIPEPGTLAMLILGGLWFVGYCCRRRRQL